ncbi:PAS domain-containing protein [Undibacterium sp. TC9W]|uniref:PAS domain-containing protein n=1 Tax=Undibacterium sp. TC9W TaxID=3413053 RepID=UPI003BF15EB8
MQINSDTTLQDPLNTTQSDQLVAQHLLARVEQLEHENAALKLTLQSQQAKQSFYEDFFQHSRTPCLIIDPAGEVMHVNLSAASLLGATPENLEGQQLRTFVFEDQAVLETQLSALTAPGETSTCEIRAVKADRELILLRLEMIVLNSNSEQSCLGVQLTDITRQQGKLMSQAEGQYFASVVAENVPGMVAYWNSDLRCTYANHHYLSWFGRTTEQMQGIHMQDLLGQELFSKNIAYIKAVLKGVDQQFERTLVKANGDVGHTWAQYIAHTIDGIVQGFFVLVTDVSLLKKSQKALLESEAKNRALVRAIPDLILTIHSDGRYLDVHAPDLGVLLQSKEQILLQKVEDVLPPNLANQYRNAIDQALNKGRLQEFRYDLSVPGKGVLQFEARVVPCDEENVIAIIRDITETERERRAQELRLSERLQVRENDLREIQLSLANLVQQFKIEPTNRVQATPSGKALPVSISKSTTAGIQKIQRAVAKTKPMPKLVTANEGSWEEF